jgi:recombination associated protein RdgC
MGALKGSVTVRRYVVKGKPPSDKGKLVKGVRAHVLLPIDPKSDVERSYGWALAENPEELELSSESIFVGGALVLALRVDTLKPPAAIVKRMVAEKLRGLGRKPGKKEKQEAKDWVVKSLRTRIFPAMRAYDVVWQMDESRLFFFSHGKGPNELLIDLFQKSFGVELVACGPGVIAAEGGRLPASLAPTPELAFGFAGLPGRPVAGEDGEFGFGDDNDDDLPAGVEAIDA